MKRMRSLRGLGAVGLVAIIGAMATGFSASKLTRAAALEKLLRPTGEAQLISVQPLGPMAGSYGEMCQWQPASAPAAMTAAFQAQAAANHSAGAQTAERANLKPIRMIRDPYAAYSAVAVDPVNNEVVLTDENLFQILVYDRTANTPPTATMTEPKRIIGGLKTKIEFQCGLYIDPSTGNIYGVNNDTVDTLVTFSRNAKGDVPPDKELHTPHGTFGIAVDEVARELFLTVQHDSAIVVYDKDAEKEQAPLRLIQGDATQLADPHGIAVDPKNQLMFVTNHGAAHSVDASLSQGGRGGNRKNWPLDRSYAVPGSGRTGPPSITVYPLKASGNVPPVRVISGPKTQMNWPTGIVVDPDRNEILIANDMEDSILVFDANASGDVAPKRVIKGPKTMLKNPVGIYLDLVNNELWSANFGNHTATVYKRGAGGDVAPLRVIRSGPLEMPSLGIGNPHPVAYDTKREEILVPNCVAHPQIAIFPRTADQNAKPSRKIEGQKTMLGRTMHAISYDEIHDEFTVPQQFGQAILTFRGGAIGEEAPIRVIQGSKTRLTDPDRLAVDPVHDEIYVPADDVVLVFDRRAQGNVAPIRAIEGPDTGLGASAVAVDPINNLLIVGGGGGGGQGGTRFRVFDRTANGNVKPKMVISGPRSLGGPFAVYPPKKYIIATDRCCGGELASDESYMGVWSYEKEGNMPPLWRIGGPHGIFQMPRGVALDTKNKSIIVSDKRLNAVLTFYFPEMF